MSSSKKPKKWDNMTKLGMSALLIILIESIILTIIVLKQQFNPDNNMVNAQIVNPVSNTQQPTKTSY
jgi:hypothetical protein